jgi:hypothetical protein
MRTKDELMAAIDASRAVMIEWKKELEQERSKPRAMQDGGYIKYCEDILTREAVKTGTLKWVLGIED